MDSLIKQISLKFSVQEAAIRIMLTLFSGYPIAIIYNLLLVKQSVIIKQLFFISCGVGLGYFNHGFDLFHTIAIVLGTYLILIALKGTKEAVGASFVWSLGYLMYGYMKTQGSEYNFEWTIPGCILTLRLTAIVFDVYDGARIKRGKKEIKNDSALFELPQFLDVFAACYLPFSFLVGPQFELKRFQNFLRQHENLLSKSLSPGLQKMLLGSLYLIAYAIGNVYFPITLMESEYFDNSGFFWRFTIVALTTKIQCCKYIGIWVIAEGSLITSGFTYNKETEKFDGYYNIDVYLFETVTTFGDLIHSFNVTTNHWSAKYMFKRLKFLGNRIASHALTLTFLAVWHGWMSGYYVTFMMEFIIMKMEWEILSIVKSFRQANSKFDRLLNAPLVRWPLIIFFHMYTVYMFGYCLISFNLLSFNRWFPVLKKLYFAGHIIYLSWIPLSPLVLGYFLKSSKDKTAKSD